ncbi:cytochrome b5 [Auricularia subglabra TFB-10046 SS5]|nr:cytochrome b5 [Auricularia subglabra TFB-10046 SS5]
MSKVVSFDEWKQHQTRSDCWTLIHDKIYDVSKFLDEHPGGDEVILAEAGKDATEAFEDVGHSDEARSLLAGMLVGTFDGGEANASSSGSRCDTRFALLPRAPLTHGPSISYILPLAALGAYFAYRAYFSQ